MVKSMVSEERGNDIAERKGELRECMGGNPGKIEQMLPVLEEKTIDEFI